MAGRREKWRRFVDGYERFMEKQGFLIVVGACVAVIICTAVWTGSAVEKQPQSPGLPPKNARSAAQLMQQSLAEITPAPTVCTTKAPSAFVPPLEDIVVIRPFDGDTLQRSEVTGIYRVHDAVDLAASVGTPVKAMADGVVLLVREKGADGVCVAIGHEDVQITYAGMSAAAGLRSGDPVEQGQTIGFAGPGPDDENDMEPHVHLRIVKGGAAVDPAPYLQ